MDKFLRYVCIFVFFFFLFDMNVDAKLSNYGDCMYVIQFSDGNYRSIKFNQNMQGVIIYYHSDEKVTSVDDSRWIKNGDSNGMKNGDKLDKCPGYIHHRIDSGFLGTGLGAVDEYYFSDNSSEEGYTTSGKVISGSGLKIPTSETGLGASCSQTTNIDWLKPVPDSSELVQGEAHCLYYGENDEGCHIIQLDYRPGDGDVSVSNNFLNWPKYSGGMLLGIKNTDEILRLKVGCSKQLGVNDTGSYVAGVTTSLKVLQYHFGKGNYLNLKLFKEVVPEVTPAIVDPNKIEVYDTCDQLMNDDLTKLLKTLIGILRILVPIMLICLGVADFGMAIFAADEDKMKKAQGKFIRRLIIGVVIFLIPFILKMFLSLAHEVWPFVDATLCGII